MEDHTGEVMPGRPQTEELAIEHVRKPGDRMPVPGMRVAKGPIESVPGQTGSNFGSICDVSGVIKVDELCVPKRPIGTKDERYKGGGDFPGLRPYY